MKRISLAMSLIAAAFGALAAIESISIPTGSIYDQPTSAKVVAVKVLSTVASGTATVKAESRLIQNANDIITTFSTNFTYSLVYSNGTDIVTNTVATDYSPFPDGMDYIRYTTNTLVTSTTVTNVVPRASLTVTNSLSEQITCSGGFGSSTPTNSTICPGDRIFVTGSASGIAIIIIER